MKNRQDPLSRISPPQSPASPSPAKSPALSPTPSGRPTQDELRFAKFGFNGLPEKKRNAFLGSFSHFRGPIPWKTEAAAILSLIARRRADFVIIPALLLANWSLGFWENFRASAGNGTK